MGDVQNAIAGLIIGCLLLGFGTYGFFSAILKKNPVPVSLVAFAECEIAQALIIVMSDGEQVNVLDLTPEEARAKYELIADENKITYFLKCDTKT